MAPLYEENLSAFEDLPERLTGSKPPQYAGGRLGGFSITVSALAVLRGPAFVVPLLGRVVPSIPRVIRELPRRIDKNAMLPAAYTLSLLNVARCCGVALPEEAGEVEDKWLPQLAERATDMTERERHTLALAAAAARLPALVSAFTNTRALPERLVPGEVHGFNVPGFAVYIATAIEREAIRT